MCSEGLTQGRGVYTVYTEGLVLDLLFVENFKPLECAAFDIVSLLTQGLGPQCTLTVYVICGRAFGPL